MLCSPASMAAGRLRPGRPCWPGCSPSVSASVPRSSARRLGTRCSGVPVITSRPNPHTSASSGAATHGVSPATSGAETAYPISPPAPRMASAPLLGDGVPCAMCTSPSVPMTSAAPPMVIRPVSALRSGWRKNRHASRASSSGTVQASDPNAPVTTVVISRPRPLPIPTQVVAATTTAAPSRARPMPSRRCIGSRSRALLPTWRTAAPAACVPDPLDQDHERAGRLFLLRAPALAAAPGSTASPGRLALTAGRPPGVARAGTRRARRGCTGDRPALRASTASRRTTLRDTGRHAAHGNENPAIPPNDTPHVSRTA